MCLPLFFKRFIDGFGTVLHMQFLVDTVNMLSYRAGGNMELIGYFLVQETAGQEIEDLIFTGGQAVQDGRSIAWPLLPERIDKLTGDIGTHRRSSLVKLFQRLQD